MKYLLLIVLIYAKQVYARRIYRVLLFSTVAIPGLIEYKIESRKDNPNYNPLHKKYAPRAAKVVSKLEGIYYKIAQIFGSRNDVSPEEYRCAFEPFLDQVKSKPWRTIRSSFTGLSCANIQINKEAFRAASIGQVHKGTYQGTPVVIKLLYPSVEKNTRSDLWAFKVWVRRALPGMYQQVDTFSDVILKEFDLRKEAKVQEVIRNYFVHGSIPNDSIPNDSIPNGSIPKIIIPKVIEAKKTCIIMEYVEGDALLTYLNQQNPRSRRTIIEKIFTIMAHQILFAEYFSTDPHPGNFLVSDGKIVVLDFGQHSQLSKMQKCYISQLWKELSACTHDKEAIHTHDKEAIHTHDKEAIHKILQKLGFFSESNSIEFFYQYSLMMFDTVDDGNSITHFNKIMLMDKFTQISNDIMIVTKVIAILRGLASLFKINISFASIVTKVGTHSSL